MVGRYRHRYPGLLTAFLAVIQIISPSIARSQYYLSRTDTLLPAAVTLGSHALPIPVNREDVKAIGMGRTQVGNGRVFNAMMYNPALLAHDRVSFEVLSLQASVPKETFDAAMFVSDHSEDFESAMFLTTLQEGVDQFDAAGTAEEKLAALQKIQHGLQFPRDLLDQVIGSSTDPKTHGVMLLPAITVQSGHFGLSLYGTARSDLQVIQSPTLDALVSMEVPTTLRDPEQVATAVRDLADVLSTVIDAQGDIVLEKALPKAFSVSNIDLVAAAGYGFPLSNTLSLGANLKLVNRRFSTKRIAADNFDTIVESLLQDLKTDITGVTMDLGALYRLESTGTTIGLSLQNVLPIQTIRSCATATYVQTRRMVDRDALGRPVVNARGDTGIVTQVQKVSLESPFELKLPVIANLGASLALSSHWDVNVDWVDVAGQDDRYEAYLDRLRAGMEYRLDAIDGVLGIAPRIGLADGQPTYGLGVNLFRVLQVDGAYAYDPFVKSPAYYAQVRIGW